MLYKITLLALAPEDRFVLQSWRQSCLNAFNKVFCLISRRKVDEHKCAHILKQLMMSRELCESG